METKTRWKDHCGLVFLYPMAALLVFFAARLGRIPNFERDWPYIVGGPAGVLVWYLIAASGRAWPSLIVGYFVGAAACAVTVTLLGLLARRIKRSWD